MSTQPPAGFSWSFRLSDVMANVVGLLFCVIAGYLLSMEGLGYEIVAALIVGIESYFVTRAVLREHQFIAELRRARHEVQLKEIELEQAQRIISLLAHHMTEEQAAEAKSVLESVLADSRSSADDA